MNDETKVETSTETSEIEQPTKAQEEPAEKVQAEAPVLNGVTSKTVTLPITGEKVVLHKLKAGPYYQAQQIFTEWLGHVQDVMKYGKIDLDKVKNDDGTPNIEALKKETEKSGSQLVDDIIESSKKANEASFRLTAVCLGKTVEEVEQEYYPEDFEVLLKGAMALNKFTENLKKSEAPTGGTGA